MSETDKLKVEMYDDVVKEKNKEYIELTCRFRETCNDIKNKDKEIERLNNIINESAEEILKELEENHHLSYGVALAIRQKLLDYKELKGIDK